MNVLAIGRHPDDVEIACSGTLVKCRERGDRVVVCHVSDGDLGHVVIPPEELRVIRRQEACRAGEMVGIEVISAGFSDLDIFDGDRRSRDRIVDVIRYADPDVIITQAPDDYMPDHTAVSRLVFDASFAATLPNYRFRRTAISPSAASTSAASRSSSLSRSTNWASTRAPARPSLCGSFGRAKRSPSKTRSSSIRSHRTIA